MTKIRINYFFYFPPLEPTFVDVCSSWHSLYRSGPGAIWSSLASQEHRKPESEKHRRNIGNHRKSKDNNGKHNKNIFLNVFCFFGEVLINY